MKRIVRFLRDYWFNELAIRNGFDYARVFYKPVFISALFPLWLSFILLLVSLDFKYQTGFFLSIKRSGWGPLLLSAIIFTPYLFLSMRLLAMVKDTEINEHWSKTDLRKARMTVIFFLLVSIALLFLIPSTLAK